MTTPFLHRALHNGIDVVLLDEHGGPGGRLASLECTDPTARRAQYRAADDGPAARELARCFVDGKIANMRVALLRADRRGPDPVRADVAETLAAACRPHPRLQQEQSQSHARHRGHRNPVRSQAPTAIAAGRSR